MQLSHRNLVKLDTVNADAVGAHARQRDGALGVGFHEQLLLDALRLDSGQLIDEALKPAEERKVMLEHQHGFRQAQAVRESATRHNSAREQVFCTRHAFTRCQHLAARVRCMGRIHHRARFSGHGRQVVEHVQAHLPGGMQIARAAAHAEERLAGFDTLPVGRRRHNVASQLLHNAANHVRACQHAVFAREIFHLARLVADAQDLAGQIDIRHVLGNKAVNARI